MKLDDSALALPLAQPPAMPTRTADILVDLLIAHGVEVIFGLPGGPISPIHDALLDRQHLRVVTTRHESGALFAAAGYARATGKLGVAMVTSGPGVLNALTGLASAFCDGQPVLLLVGEVARRNYGRGALQDGSAYGLQMVEILKRVTKHAAEVLDPERAPALLGAAIATACSAPAGPVALTLPVDMLVQQSSPPRILRARAGEPTIDGSVVAAAHDALCAGERVAIFAGAGARGGGAPARIIEVAERLQCPVITTPKGKGVFPEDHPLALGIFGMGGHPSASEYLQQGVDTLLVLGTSLGELSTDGWSPLLRPRRAMIHVDVDERQLGRNYTPQLGVVATVESFLGRLLERLPARPPQQWGGIKRHQLGGGAEGTIAPHLAMTEIQELLPRDTIFTVDSGEHFLFATHYLQTVVPDGFVAMTGLGSMGQSLGAAIGAQLARPERVVAAICGDGCFAMNAFEVSTAVAEDVPILVFVINDQRLGMVELGHQSIYGRTPSYSTAPMDVARLARALGAQSLTITGAGQLREAELLQMRRSGPVVVDIRIDPQVRMPKKDRFVAVAAPRADSPLRVVN